MKKLITVGIITVLAFGLAGCNWFEPAEPTVEEPEATDVAEPFVYENKDFDFSLTFPTNWGEVAETKSTLPLDIQTNVYTLTSKNDAQRYVEVYIFDAEDKDHPEVVDLPANLIKEADNYVYYLSSSGDCYGAPGCEDEKYKTILDESKEISSSFELI